MINQILFSKVYSPCVLLSNLRSGVLSTLFVTATARQLLLSQKKNAPDLRLSPEALRFPPRGKLETRVTRV